MTGGHDVVSLGLEGGTAKASVTYKPRNSLLHCLIPL